MDAGADMQLRLFPPEHWGSKPASRLRSFSLIASKSSRPHRSNHLCLSSYAGVRTWGRFDDLQWPFDNKPCRHFRSTLFLQPSRPFRPPRTFVKLGALQPCVWINRKRLVRPVSVLPGCRWVDRAGIVARSTENETLVRLEAQRSLIC